MNPRRGQVATKFPLYCDFVSKESASDVSYTYLPFQPIVLAPNDFANIKANVKVASTENGIIFGNIVYDVLGAGSDRNVVVLNDIHIDIMDYIVPASCTETEFRSMWAEFEWENKVKCFFFFFQHRYRTVT